MNSTNAKKHVHDEIRAQEFLDNTPIAESTATKINPPPDPGSDNQYAELNDKYLRLYSDFDNFRKRTLKEKVETS